MDNPSAKNVSSTVLSKKFIRLSTNASFLKEATMWPLERVAGKTQQY